MLKRLLTIILCAILCFSALSISGCKKDESFTVTFSGGYEGASPYYGEEIQRVTNANQLVEPIYVREGYNFVGWNVSISRITSSTTVVAQWKKYPLEVVFYSNGGADDQGNRTVAITADSAYEVINNAPQFKKEGYTLSWSPQLETITSSCEVNAVWTLKEYSLTFKDKNGQDFENNTLNVAYNQLFDHTPITAPQVVGEKFAYWADEQGVPFDKGIVWDIDCSAIFTAVYVPQTEFVISYDLNGGNKQDKNSMHFYNENTQLNITNPTRKGYRFNGYEINGGSEKYFGKDITLEHFKLNGAFADVNLKATWGIEPYTATLDANGGQITGQGKMDFFYGYQIENLVVPQKENHEFIGWYVGDVQIKEGDVWEFAQDVVISARYLAKYKVKFSLTSKVAINNEQILCKVVKWGSLDNNFSFEEIEIEIVEGQSLLSKGIGIMPVVDPIEEPNINEYVFGNYWKYVDGQNVGHKVLVNTPFNSENFLDITAGDTIILVPHIKLAWTPNY